MEYVSRRGHSTSYYSHMLTTLCNNVPLLLPLLKIINNTMPVFLSFHTVPVTGTAQVARLDSNNSNIFSNGSNIMNGYQGVAGIGNAYYEDNEVRTGIFQHGPMNLWRARILANAHVYDLGTFINYAFAANAYLQAEASLLEHGHLGGSTDRSFTNSTNQNRSSGFSENISIRDTNLNNNVNGNNYNNANNNANNNNVNNNSNNINNSNNNSNNTTISNESENSGNNDGQTLVSPAAEGVAHLLTRMTGSEQIEIDNDNDQTANEMTEI